MPFNGSGTFQRIYNWVNDAAANIKIRADRMDNEMDGMATALSTCITKNGQTTITANLPMATYRHTGVGAGVTRTDYARLDQLQDAKINWVAAGGTADAITAAYSPAITTLVDGQLCYVRASDANATTTPTFSPNALTARTIVKEGGSALVAGDIAGAGAELILRYDLSNTRWELLNPKPVTYTLPAEIEVDGVKALSSAGVDLLSSGDNVCINFGAGGSANSTLGGNMSGASTYKLVNMVDPTSAQDYATKAYTDNQVTTAKTYSGTYTSASGTQVDFTGIPSGVKKIILLVHGVSMSGTDNIIVRIGDSGGLESTGYVSSAGNDTSLSTLTTGFLVTFGASAATVQTGRIELNLADASAFAWVASGATASTARISLCTGSKSLSAELDRVSFLTSGSNTFDAGSFQILYSF